jgi:hypothetical protein
MEKFRGAYVDPDLQGHQAGASADIEQMMPSLRLFLGTTIIVAAVLEWLGLCRSF